jgi:hypothetical protein
VIGETNRHGGRHAERLVTAAVQGYSVAEVLKLVKVG